MKAGGNRICKLNFNIFFSEFRVVSYALLICRLILLIGKKNIGPTNPYVFRVVFVLDGFCTCVYRRTTTRWGEKGRQNRCACAFVYTKESQCISDRMK